MHQLRPRYSSSTAASDCRYLWAALDQLANNGDFRRLFGGRLVAINIMPNRPPDEDPRRVDYTFGRVVQDLAVEAEHVVHISENPAAFLVDSA